MYREELQLWQEQMFNSLRHMIEWTWIWQENVRQGLGDMALRNWAKEVCSVKYMLPRQSGHTTMIKKLCGEFGPNGTNSPYGINPVIIFPNTNIAYNSGFLPTWSWVGTPDDLQKFRGKSPNMVICDVSSVLSTGDITNIYRAFENIAYKDPFIFLFME